MTIADLQARFVRGWPTWLGVIGVLAIVVTASFADRYVRHGYTVSWYARTADGQRIETARTRDPRTVIATVDASNARWAGSPSIGWAR
jgi:hypothetical protein